MSEIRLKAIPERKLFENEETGFKILSMRPKDSENKDVKTSSYGNFTIKGSNIPEFEFGVDYDLTIKHGGDGRYPESYSLIKNNYVKPLSADEQWNFLKAIINENQFENIQTIYNPEDLIIDIINNGEFNHEEVKGYGEATYDTLKNKVAKNTIMAETLSELSIYGVDYNTVVGLYKVYNSHEKIMEVIMSNPYKLINENGFGFIKADNVAMQLGIEKDAPERVRAGIDYVFEEISNSGDTWLSKKMLYNKMVKILDVKGDVVNNVLNNPPETIIIFEEKYGLKRNIEKELDIAKNLIKRANVGANILQKRGYHPDKFIKDFEERTLFKLSDEQKDFLERIGYTNTMFLVGNAGSGKSSMMKIIIDIINELNEGVEFKDRLETLLLAPTGKASRVLGNYTGEQAHTIHKVLFHLKEDDDESAKLQEDLIIVDEASMCDINIINKLLKFVKEDAIIVFIGDDAQIPSVGVGNFLYDCINSDVAPVVKLTKVFRQNKSGALYSITKTRQGKKFLRQDMAKPQTIGDNFIFKHMIKEHIPREIKKSYQKMISKGYSEEDIGILVPTNIGDIGTIKLNAEMQKLTNPKDSSKMEREVGTQDKKRVIREGDYIMITKNTYSVPLENNDGMTNIFNGETGKVLEIDSKDKRMLLKFNEDEIYLSFVDVTNKIYHAWCLTTYKAQGSQYKSVIVIVDRSAIYQMNANLLYTGLSRTSEFLAVYGQADIFNKSLGKFANYSRKTLLGDFLVKVKDLELENNQYNNVTLFDLGN